jgi:hypothetical protein
MTIRSITLMATAGAALGAASAAFAEDADYYRGGWRTDLANPHIYQFVIKGDQVTGIYCTHCADATTLAPLEGTFDEENGLAFTIRHLNLDGSAAYEDQMQARLQDNALVIRGTQGGPGGGAFEREAIKDWRGPVGAPYPVAVLPPGSPPPPVLQIRGGGGGGGAPAAYVQPAPWKQSLSADDVVGVWLGFGVGMDKQIFIIRRDGDGLFGLVCGRCDNPYTFGALDDFEINGDTLAFDIVHQDWGEGTTAVFERRVTAHIAMNEMRISAVRHDADSLPPGAPGAGAIVASLVGPIAIEATAGNVVSE